MAMLKLYRLSLAFYNRKREDVDCSDYCSAVGFGFGVVADSPVTISDTLKPVNRNYPKVCCNCRRRHITTVEEEVKVDNGRKVRHKDCLEMLDWVRDSEDTVKEEKVNASY